MRTIEEASLAPRLAGRTFPFLFAEGAHLASAGPAALGRSSDAESAWIDTPARLTARPAAPTLFGDFVFLVFALAQAADGCLTYVGVATMGVAMEANPLIVWYIAVCGAGVALTGAKIFAIVCGAVLHLNARHRTIGVLAVLYLGGAVWPWTRVLWP